MHDSKTLEAHGLKADEYERIKTLLGREPNLVELGMFSVMWSEHCSYKSTRIHLKKLPTKGPRVAQGPGENAGALDIGDGLLAVFKIESHNHPSFIEPYQGAATGVGGILRDIFTMGARPIAVLNSLRFSDSFDQKTRRIISGVVAGVGGYGNAFGCPTVGGEVVFEPCYAGNPLVNAFCLGMTTKDKLFLGRAEGIGNTVFYVGAKTGRDGIHGATMASSEFGEGSEEKRPTVQVGDPFMEKILLESCLEAMATGAVVGIQDMGAAGLTCATSETAGRAGTGIEFDVSKVPQRETGMTAYEVMLSESQERMLLVAKKGREDEIRAVFEKWDLHAEAVGVVTGDGHVKVYKDGKLEADIPASALTDEAPLYDRPWVEPKNPAEDRDLSDIAVPTDLAKAFLAILGSPNIASKRWVYRQYDSTVQTGTVQGPGVSDAAVVRIHGSKKGLAIALDGNGRYGFLNAKQGAMLAVAEACRNVVATGALPIGLTNCLNFGNPEKPEVMGQIVKALEGIGEASRALDAPVTGGNVSLYNETDGVAIYPTPVIGAVGLFEEVTHALSRAFARAGDTVLLLGDSDLSLGGSEYMRTVHGTVAGALPQLDLKAEKALYDVVLDLVSARKLASAHDVADGGLAVALAESCFNFESASLGGDFELGDPGSGDDFDETEPARTDALLFSEGPSRMIVSTPDPEAVETRAAKAGVPCRRIGVVGGSHLTLRSGGVQLTRHSVSELLSAWTSLERSLSA
ncbi:MAG TPA: phosphoribosylformylglycinamidine synthase subunit PurL [Vicinamibacteria bacterium]|nr:phosphoribosylformylglycinamidine synthase subunit PurL [Vicinamibacteria bacterium]